MLLLGVLIALSAMLAFGVMTLPKPRPLDADGFSSARVARDIEVISREPHSVAHPVEREKVREYIIMTLVISIICRMARLFHSEQPMTDMV